MLGSGTPYHIQTLGASECTGEDKWVEEWKPIFDLVLTVPWYLECRVLFLASSIGSRCMDEHFEILNTPTARSTLAGLVRVVRVGDESCSEPSALNEDYENFLSSAAIEVDSLYETATQSIHPSDVASLQFTSGRQLLLWSNLTRLQCSQLYRHNRCSQGIDVNPYVSVHCEPGST